MSQSLDEDCEPFNRHYFDRSKSDCYEQHMKSAFQANKKFRSIPEIAGHVLRSNPELNTTSFRFEFHNYLEHCRFISHKISIDNDYNLILLSK